jgi:hypothetical protein
MAFTNMIDNSRLGMPTDEHFEMVGCIDDGYPGFGNAA